jgi:hypothetical protein
VVDELGFHLERVLKLAGVLFSRKRLDGEARAREHPRSGL